MILSSLPQQAAAQNFSGIDNIYILKQVPYNVSVAASEKASLVSKLPILQNPDSQALDQLNMLSPRSIGKLDRSLDDKALVVSAFPAVEMIPCVLPVGNGNTAMQYSTVLG